MTPGIKKTIQYALLALLIYMPVFGFLDTLPIRIWDEARIAISSQEMLKDGDYIVVHCTGEPELWNTKPPLLMWMQVTFMKWLGVNEVAVRLPSALAAFGTCLCLLFFSINYLKKFWFGFIAVLVLITCDAYVNTHMARTGDYESLLVLFTTLACLLIFSYCETGNIKFLYLFFLSLGLAVLTKGVAGLLVTPALAVYCVLRKQFVPLLKSKHFYIGFVGFAILALGYYILREWKDPGYVAAVQENELGGRFLVAQGGRDFDFWFYLDNFLTYRLTDRFIFVPCGLLLGLLSRDQRIKRLALFILLVSTFYFVVISTAKTKLEWYDAPLYPFIALSIAFFINYIFEYIRDAQHYSKNLTHNVFGFVFLCVVFAQPYQHIFEKTHMPKEESWDYDFYQIGHYLKAALRGKFDLDGKYLLYEGYDLQNLFYIRLLNEKGVNVSIKKLKDVKVGDVVITSQNPVRNHLRNNYHIKELERDQIVYTYKILQQRDSILIPNDDNAVISPGF